MRAAWRSSIRWTRRAWRSLRPCPKTCCDSAGRTFRTSMPKRYPLIVFDWDGTLFDSAAVIAEGIQHAARDMGLPVPDRETASHVIGLGLSDSLRHAMPTLVPERYQDFLALYR